MVSVLRRTRFIGAARRDAVLAGLSRNEAAGILPSCPRDVGHVVDGAAGSRCQRAAYRQNLLLDRHDQNDHDVRADPTKLA